MKAVVTYQSPNRRGVGTLCDPGDSLHRGQVRSINVADGMMAVVHDGPNKGGRKSRPIYAGHYDWIDICQDYGWMRGRGPKLIEVTTTSFEARELLHLIWWQKDRGSDKQRTMVQKLPPGEDWDASKGHFLNDRVENIRVPKNATATIYENSGKSGRFVTLQPGYAFTKFYDLYKRVSSIDYRLDEWKDLGKVLGGDRNRKPMGKAIVETIKGTGAEGDSFSKTIVLGIARTKGTNWHASASVTASVTIKQGGGPAPGGAEQSLSSTIEAGGGGDQSVVRSREVSVTINGVIGSSGVIEADAIGQLFEVDQIEYRRVKNVRTGEIARIEGVTPAEKFEVSFNIRHGDIISHEVVDPDDEGSSSE